jgi:hypothetical protein
MTPQNNPSHIFCFLKHNGIKKLQIVMILHSGHSRAKEKIMADRIEYIMTPALFSLKIFDSMYIDKIFNINSK